VLVRQPRHFHEELLRALKARFEKNMTRHKGLEWDLKAIRHEFPNGTKVKIASRGALEAFARTWKYHNPLHEDQRRFHDIETLVEDVYFYHGGR
jgi:hypothetical protein